MALRDLVGGFTESGTVKRVFGDPIEKDGVLVIPVATIRGAFGGGEGVPMVVPGDAAAAAAPAGEEKPAVSGWGGGGMWSASPTGAYVLKDGEVTWVPAVDQNRAILLSILAGMFSLLILRSIARAVVKRG